jgi:hypothetical protein
MLSNEQWKKAKQENFIYMYDLFPVILSSRSNYLIQLLRGWTQNGRSAFIIRA